MNLRMIGVSHHTASLEVRERLAFNADRARDALAQLRGRFPGTEAVLLSTCNRVEFYTATENPDENPTRGDVAEFLAEFHHLNRSDVFDHLSQQDGRDAVEHLFRVAASLDSMVVGEAQILSQVKQAYQLAIDCETAGPVLHAALQAAIHAAKRIATQTPINERRVSIPSVAVADFASQIFERFDDKKVVVIGAGEMGQETLRYLIDEGAQCPAVVNRSPRRAESLAEAFGGTAESWDRLDELIVRADLIVSTTSATEPVVTLERFKRLEHDRYQRPLFVLDLAVPRDFDPAIGKRLGVYLYSIDDLREACEANRAAREKAWPKARQIVEEETARFMAQIHLRATGPTIKRLKARADRLKQQELSRLLNKLGEPAEPHKDEIERTLDRLINKLLHPPLESLRDEAEKGAPHGLLDALRRLFQLRD